ncbi:MAG TPA: AAA family ATPase, partial [Gaiellaceae bacterium]|nr:AAA family ATPase [Gaiellaceae bacterium]
APLAHEDDPERAVRAALAARDALGELNAADPTLGLHVRIGVTTGEAMIALSARPKEGEGMATGDVVNTCSRLQSAAPVDGILVDEPTYRATSTVIEYRDAEPVQAKGKAEPVPVWEVVAPRTRLGVDIAFKGGAELVGRSEELRLLRDALARSERERSPQLVTLVGLPGIGKSRLLFELWSALDSDPTTFVYWRQGRSLPYGEGVSFWALGEMVKAEAGILETDRDEDTEAKLRASVAALLPDEEEDAAWVARQLRPLVGLDAAAGGGSPDEAYSAWRRFFEAMAESGPAVLVFEDLQWADEGLLDFVEHLVDWASGVPLLVLCTARPELLDRRPGWGGGTANAATVSLAPLTTEETARLIASLAERALMPAEVQKALLARAGGNPLYAEEFVRMASERGGDVEHLPMPESVQGIIAARLDDLDPTDKAVLQDAAVIGKVFWLGAVADLGNVPRWELERRLHGLERRQLVRRERRATVAGEREYAFWHVLVRDVAYGQIPRARRAEKHRQAAEWIESLSPERAADRADLLAHHYLAAVEYARASGQDAGPLEAPARAALAAAGERALTLNAFPAAERYFRAALELWPEDDDARANALFGLGRALHAIDESGEEELEAARAMFTARGEIESAAEAEIALALLAWHRGTVARTLEHVDRAATLVEDQPPSPGKAHALAAVSRYRMLGNRNVEAIAAGREALAMAEQLGLRELTAHALNNIGTARVAAGDDRGIADLERSIEIAEEIGSIEASRGYINLASVIGMR